MQNFINFHFLASEKFKTNIVKFARISDGSEISDNDVLMYIYQSLDKRAELELVALTESEEFCKFFFFYLFFLFFKNFNLLAEDDRKYFKLEGYSRLRNIIKEFKDAESVDFCFLVDW